MNRRTKKSPVSWKVKLVLVGLCGAAVLWIALQIASGVPFGMREVKSFRAYGICAAQDPTCGWCPGTVTNDRCFVGFGTFSQYP